MEPEKFEIKPAIRSHVIPLIGISGKSGSGKTKSALLLARGFVGPTGRIVVIDTENGRARDFAGRFKDDPECEIPGGFSVLDLDPPFSPERCLKALKQAAQSADIVVFDSISHSWNGEGGVLSTVEKYLDQKCGDNWEMRDKFKMAAWAKVGPAHALMFNEIARFPVPLICCFRAKDKLKIEQVVKDGKKRTEFHTELDSPIQRGDLIWEMRTSFAVEAREDGGGHFKLLKRGTETLARALEAGPKRICERVGEIIAEWCRGNSGVSPQPTQAAPAPTSAPDPIKAAKKILWDLCEPFRGPEKNWSAAEIKMVSMGVLSDTQEVSKMSLEELVEAASKLRVVLAEAKSDEPTTQQPTQQ